MKLKSRLMQILVHIILTLTITIYTSWGMTWTILSYFIIYIITDLFFEVIEK